MWLYILLVTAVLGTYASPEGEDEYKAILEDIDVDSILNNDRILDSYVKCILDKGPCSERPQKIKDKIPESFETVCGLCTDKQKGLFKHVLQVFIPKRPEEWKQILEIYDPDGKYWPALKNFIES